jgi:hypothetical protein
METNKKFIRAEEGPDNSVIYYDEDGNKLKRYWKSYEGQPIEEASTRSWRNNNPGNLIISDFSKEKGAIGEAGFVPTKKKKKIKLAVFPDFDTGRKAQAARLKEGDLYIDLTLNELVRKYTGVKKGESDTEEVINYRKDIKFFTKFDMDRTIRSLSDDEYEKLLNAMMKHEGWRPGKEEYKEIKKIVAVHVNEKHAISELLVSTSAGKEWIKKSDAIGLAEAGFLDAIVVHSKKGIYLRPKFHHTPFKQMVC